ncbi:hypothetical protein [Bacillus cereus]|uniref:hypothetical protein n=1 Tax=Bacillus cereus TaxID=1396 RepID=UPI000BF58840|nr:hypothetical protein [Bacillus cereus]PER25442.1 hypothetical protein CN476_12895 [Bacillus cereus]
MEKSSFFNSIRGDRKYKAEDWANYFNKFITNGYFPNAANNLQVIASATGMNVTLKSGVAWINGYMYNNTSDLTLSVEKADNILSRIDRIVLRCDFAKREIRAYVKKGTSASSPDAPSLQRDADAFELAVAEVRVEYMNDIIAQKDVTDLRLNKDLCGVVNSLLQADTTTIFNQYWDWFIRTKEKHELDNATTIADLQKFVDDNKKKYNQEFDAWFEGIKDVLDTNTAGYLLNEVTKIKEKLNVLDAEIMSLTTKVDTVTEKQNMSLEPLSRKSLAKDENGIYTVVEWRTKTDVLRLKSILSDPDGTGDYRKQTVTQYKKDGVTVDSTEIYNRILDSDGDLGDEVLQ